MSAVWMCDGSEDVTNMWHISFPNPQITALKCENYTQPRQLKLVIKNTQPD